MNRCEDYCKAYKQLGLTACEGCCGRIEEKGGVVKWKVLIYLIVVTLLVVV